MAPPDDAPNRRQTLVRAAFRRIAEYGFEGLRTRDVAQDVGVNVATLHYYYPTKEALIRGVIGHAMQRFGEAMPRDGSPAEQLRAHLNAVRRIVKDDADLCAVVGELTLRAPRDPALAEIMKSVDETWHSRVRAILAGAVDGGVLDSHLDPTGAATFMVSALKGSLLPSVSGSRAEHIDQVFDQLERWLDLNRTTS